jgi:hypothetical protein
MASIENRSRFVVAVKGRPDLTLEFPFSEAEAARTYLEKCRAEGFKPKLTQNENNFLVRIRNKGSPSRCSKSPQWRRPRRP